LPAFDERDDLHLRAALGAEQRIDLIHLLDQRCPPLPRFFGAGVTTEFWTAAGGA
jgi:hypothetical protein